jgi:hypothetical protein
MKNQNEIPDQTLDYVEIPFDAIYEVARSEKAYAVALMLELALYSHEHEDQNPIELSALDSFVPKCKVNRVLRLLVKTGLVEKRRLNEF